MSWRVKNLVSSLFFRPWLRVPLGIWIVVAIVYYRSLISRVKVIETQNEALKSQLKLSQYTMRRISVIFDHTYQVPLIPDAVGTICETIQLALVCMGKCTHIVIPMLKSLLHHRQNPIHFHFVVDSAAHQTMTKLFDTWDLPDVKYTCYDAQNHLSQVNWIPNIHHSGIYPLVKLLLPDILPKTLHKVIVLDSDLTLLCDVAELWYMFGKMNADQLIGLVENESNWYFENPDRWPALGRGYNTGVMLLDLDKIRSQADWTSLWKNAVDQNLGSLEHTALADQDVINVIIKENPKILNNISCQYNVQMSWLAKACYGENKNNVKIIHWVSPAKYDVNVRDADYFRNIHQSYVNFDGNLLREKLHRCSVSDPVTYKTNRSDLCARFRTAQSVKLRTHLYYMEYTYADMDNFDVTLVLQLSMDRLQFLERLVKYWEGPLSAAIYISDCEVTKFESFVSTWFGVLNSRRNIGYHLVFKQDSVFYPVNYLRNVALENVNTPYVFLMDVDFIPMVGLYNHLRSAIKLVNPNAEKKHLQAEDDDDSGVWFQHCGATAYTAVVSMDRLKALFPEKYLETYCGHPDILFLSAFTGLYQSDNGYLLYPFLQCLVVAAFEMQGYRNSPPRNKAALIGRLSADVSPFREQEWPRGHRATNYSRWFNSDEPYEVEWQPHYEPYLVVHRSVPKYDTRFSGFRWNKVSHSVELRAQGYRAVVLPDAFVVHTPHAPSHDITAYRDDPQYRICLALLKKEFMEDLKRKYNITSDFLTNSIHTRQVSRVSFNQKEKS